MSSKNNKQNKSPLLFKLKNYTFTTDGYWTNDGYDVVYRIICEVDGPGLCPTGIFAIFQNLFFLTIVYP